MYMKGRCYNTPLYWMRSTHGSLRMNQIYIVVLIWVVVTLIQSRIDFTVLATSSSSSSNRNPYTILGISNDTTLSPKDIKRRYYQLCLKYHPDKLQHLSCKQRKKYEMKFKDIQWAYSEITSGNCNKYRSDYTSTTSFPFTNNQYSSSSSSLYKNYRSMFEQFSQQYGSPIGTNTGRTRSPLSGLFRSYSVYDTFPFSSNSNNNIWNQQSSNRNPKFLFKQYVTLPLSDLYSGHTQYTLPLLSTNIFSCIIAAFRGGIGPYIIYQSILYAIPLLRISKLVSFGMFLYMFYQNLPILSIQSSTNINDILIVDILAGYKGNTKLIFTSDIIQIPNVEIHYIIIEDNHPIYKRISNDLHVMSCTITKKHALNGCIIEIPSLLNTVDTQINVYTNRNYDNNDNNMYIVVNMPRNTKSGDIIRIKGKGWPIRNTKTNQNHNQKQQQQQYGDLIVHINVVADETSSSSSYRKTSNNNKWYKRFDKFHRSK